MATIWQKLSDGTIHNTISATGSYRPIGEYKKTFTLTTVMSGGSDTATISLRMGAELKTNSNWVGIDLVDDTSTQLLDLAGNPVKFGLARDPILVVSAISGTLTATVVATEDDETDGSELTGYHSFMHASGSYMSFARVVEFTGTTPTSFALPPMKGRGFEQIYVNGGSSLLSLVRSKTSDQFLNGTNLVTGISLQAGYGIRLFDAEDGRGIVLP